jgi:hypothetical protein
MATVIKKIKEIFNAPVSIAPLVILRIAFGALMLVSISRFVSKGWVESMYVMPKMFFSYYGFEWVKPLSESGMYVVFGTMIVASVFIVFGFLYRFSALLFFLLFTYVELIDKTNYLNHYYFISLISFLLIFLPAHRNFSLDNIIFKRAELTHVRRAFLLIPQLQMFIVYFFAGIAKLNYDWLIEAQPLKIWLPAFSHYPVIGGLLEQDWIAYIFCWFACFYDLFIGFFLFNKRTVNIAYVFVIVFHAATAIFFNIGMFPFIMMTITIVFFKEELHLKAVDQLKRILRYRNESSNFSSASIPKLITPVFVLFFVIQIALPFRYLLYNGDLFWTEQGYRFSWRVMLMEKAGTAFFFVKDNKSGREIEIDNKQYLSYMQEKMMATQPDMMIDYAKFIKKEFEKKGMRDFKVRALSYVTVNGSGSKEFIDPAIDLSTQSNSFFQNKDWVRSY